MNFEKGQKKPFLWLFYNFSLDASQFVGGSGTGCMVSTWCRSSNHQSSLYSTPKTWHNFSHSRHAQSISHFSHFISQPFLPFSFVIFQQPASLAEQKLFYESYVSMSITTWKNVQIQKDQKHQKNTLCIDQHGSESQVELQLQFKTWWRKVLHVHSLCIRRWGHAWSF